MLFTRLILTVIVSILLLLTILVRSEETLMSGTLRVIFSKIFKPKSMSVSIICKISGPEHDKFSQEILDKVMVINKNIQVPMAINQYTAAKLAHYVHAKLIFTNSAENVRTRMETMFYSKEIQSLTTKYLIILHTPMSFDEKFIEMHKIFKNFFQFYIVDVIVLIYVEDTLHIYTYKPFTSHHCANTEPILLQRFVKVNETLTYNDLFPPKTVNLHQCPIKVALFQLPPIIEFGYHTNKLYLKGFDAEILQELADYLNFSIKVVQNDPTDFVGGDIYKNNTAIGVFKLLLERKANISIGFLSCLTKRLLLTTGSTPYYLTEVLIVFKTTPKYKPIELLFRPFSRSTWCFFLTILILKPILKRFFYTYLHLKQSFRQLLKLQWLFLIFLLRSSYEGSMFNAIRNSPHQYLPQTVDEVVQRNYSLITDYSTARILQEIDYLKNITKIVNETSESTLASLDYLPLNTGVLSSDILLASFMKKRLGNYDDYAIVRDKVSNTMNCIFFPRLSYLAPSVNLLINRYRNTGIFEKYAKQLGYENLPKTTDKLKNLSNMNLYSPLDFSVLKAVFRTLAILQCLALFVFILELLSLRLMLLKGIFGKLSFNNI